MRLSKSAIEAAVIKYANEKFKSLLEEADKNKLIAGGHLYAALFGEEAKVIKNISQGWYSERNCFNLDISGLPISNYIVCMETTRRVPLDSYVRCLPESANIEGVKTAIKNYDDKCKEREDIRERKMEFRKDMRRFASQFTTLKKLSEHNEEFAKYFFGFENVQTKNLPAITCQQILEKYPEIKVSCQG